MRIGQGQTIEVYMDDACFSCALKRDKQCADFVSMLNFKSIKNIYIPTCDDRVQIRLNVEEHV